ncbi:MAG: hypothetical protein NZ555_16315 [Geminicoccaceae bacterium]|nr:hypothetical protein [Geminicoccaceae bacterium]MCX8102689.1 hypothetical protein [Geminicoccaceae bacterium]MDW8371045.1 hypothetical protein [Geminicoccaceae bacterium]
MPKHLVPALATVLAIAALMALAGGSRDPPSAPPAASWTCVTDRGYCTTPPAPRLEPCSCADLLHGLLPGRVTSRPLPLSLLPARPAAAGDDPDETSLLAP